MKKSFSLYRFYLLAASLFLLSTTNYAQTYGGGNGTADNPYLITTSSHLSELAENTNNGIPTAGTHYKMTNDITLMVYNWVPIGYNTSSQFDGSFDGDGFTISNLSVQETQGVMTFGLFGRIGANGTVRNVSIAADGMVSASMCTGSIAGANWGTIENCVNNSSVTAWYFYSGGIVGGNYGTIRYCTNNASVSINASNGYAAGGIAGTNRGIIECCGNHGSVSTNYINAGGIAGDINKGSIINCYNRGTVTALSQIGGIAGLVDNTEGTPTIKNCYNASTIQGNEACGAVFGDVCAYEVVYDALFYDTDLSMAHGAIGYSNISFDENAMMKPSDELKSQEFIDNALGTGAGTGIWMRDIQYINEGYPVFYAEAEPISYTITATAEPTNGGTITGAGIYDANTVATLVARASESHRFVNWTEYGTEISTDETYSFEVTCDRDLVANFADITSTSDVSGIKVSLHPNPANEHITVEGEKIQSITIYDISGKAIRSLDFNDTFQDINISDLNSGMYFINITTQDGGLMKKVVKL